MDWSNVVLALAALLATAYVIAEIGARAARTALTFFNTPPASARRQARIVRLIVFAMMAALLLRAGLNIAGLAPSLGIENRVLTTWFFESGIRIGLILIFTYVVMRSISAMTIRFEDILREDETGGIDTIERVKRARTLGGLIQRVLTIAVVAMGLLTILRELRVDVTPILTGAGILGLAVGFGAQTLVRDVISGFFVILENQVRVGDVAVINGVGGLVEAINLRTIVLRDFEGVVHIFPNGAVTTLANRTKDYSYAVVDVGAAYREDPDVVIALLKDVGEELANDPAYRDAILEPLDVVGLESLGTTQITIRTRIKTVPLKQWDIARELRRRIKKAFDTRGVRIRGTQVVSESASQALNKATAHVLSETAAQNPLEPT